MKKFIFLISAILTVLFCLTVSVSAETTTECTESHTFVLEITTERTCTTSGVLTKKCTVCSYSETEVLEASHSYNTCSVTTEPKCETEGVLTYTCQYCKGTKTETIPAAHKYHYTVTKVASCKEKGTMTYYCEYCGSADKQTSMELDYAHTYVKEVTTAATCTQAGTVKYTCTSCDNSYTETIPAQHSYSDVRVLYASSCYIDGKFTYICTACHTYGTDGVISKAHEYESEITHQATCTTDGTLRHTCIHCRHTHVDIIVGHHDFSAGVTSIVYEDFTKTGVKYKKCAGCAVNEGVIANPIFIFLGYSADPETYTDETHTAKVSISAGYTVDKDALDEYRNVMGEGALEFGVVGAYESTVGKGNAPLVSATGDVKEDNVKGELLNVKRIPMYENKYSTVNAKLVNIDYNNHETYFYICLYIYSGDGTTGKTVYISDDSCREVPLPIAYAMLVESSTEHDKVTSSVTFGGIEYSTVKGTIPNEDRMDTIDASILAAGKEESTNVSVENENTIASIGNLGSFLGTVPNANELLNYYLELGGDASHYRDLDIASLLSKSTTAKNSWNTSINNILRAAELMAIEGETVNIDQVQETVVQLTNSNSLWSSERDWYKSFIDGLYYTDTDLDNLTVTVAEDGTKTYKATIVYTVIDYYSFSVLTEEERAEQFLLWGPTGQELYQLHVDGNALDFLIESTVTYNVEWTSGQRPVRDADFNTLTGFTNETYKSSILTEVTTAN